jgi:hypothetical protein
MTGVLCGWKDAGTPARFSSSGDRAGFGSTCWISAFGGSLDASNEPLDASTGPPDTSGNSPDAETSRFLHPTSRRMRPTSRRMGLGAFLAETT